MVRAPWPDIVAPGWQLLLIDMLAHGDGRVEPAARACGGVSHEGQNNPPHTNIQYRNTVHVSGIK